MLKREKRLARFFMDAIETVLWRNTEQWNIPKMMKNLVINERKVMLKGVSRLILRNVVCVWCVGQRKCGLTCSQSNTMSGFVDERRLCWIRMIRLLTTFLQRCYQQSSTKLQFLTLFYCLNIFNEYTTFPYCTFSSHQNPFEKAIMLVLNINLIGSKGFDIYFLLLMCLTHPLNPHLWENLDWLTMNWSENSTHA